MAEILIRKGANVNSEAKGWGDAPSLYALWNEQTDILRLLLDNGADANAEDNSGWSLLHYAAGIGLPDMTKLLLDKGADPNAVERESGQTSLHRAAGKGREEGRDYKTVAELLISHGAC